MRRRFLLLTSTLLIILIVVVMTGWFGIARRATVGQSSCSQSYTHYVVQPFLHDSWQCSRQTPCGVDESIDRYNAKAGVLQCLCTNSVSNNETILRYYRDELVPERYYHGQSSAGVDTICSTETRLLMRL